MKTDHRSKEAKARDEYPRKQPESVKTEPKELTQEEKRIRIAEACGWTLRPEKYATNQSPVWHHPSGFSVIPEHKRDSISYEREAPDTVLPDYFGDLNAMHEAEKSIPIDLTGQYFNQLRLQVPRTPDPDEVTIEHFYIHATAAQRAEAFGKALNLW